MSPSFGDQRTPPGRGSARFPDEGSGRPRPDFPGPPIRPIAPPSRPSLSATESRPPSDPANRGIVPPIRQPSLLKPRPDSTSSPNRVIASSSRPASSAAEPHPPGNPLQVGVGSVSVLEDPLSHVDPIPFRGLRLLVPENNGQQPPQGEVASSIMSSVSLVVRPPNKNKSTSGPKLETGRPRLERKDQEDRSSRKESASYRFIEGVSSGDADDGSPEDLFDTGDSSGAIVEESVDLPMSVTRNQDAPENLRYPDMGSASHFKFLKASFVEYVGSIVTASVPIDEDVDSKEPPIDPNLKDITNQDTTTSTAYEKEFHSDSSYPTTETLYPTTKSEVIFKDEDFIDSVIPSITETKTKDESSKIYSAKGDIGLKYLNYSVNSYTSTIFPLTETTVFNDKQENTGEVDESIENNSSHFTLAPTENVNAERNITDTVDVTTIPFEPESISTFKSGEMLSSLRDSEASEDKSSFSDALEDIKESFESGINKTPPDKENKTFTEKIQTVSSSTTQPPEEPTTLISNPFNIHTQEGHGFHKPLRKSSVVYLNSETQNTTSSTTETPENDSFTYSKIPNSSETEEELIDTVTESWAQNDGIAELDEKHSSINSSHLLDLNPSVAAVESEVEKKVVVAEGREEPTETYVETLNRSSTPVSKDSVAIEDSTTLSTIAEKEPPTSPEVSGVDINFSETTTASSPTLEEDINATEKQSSPTTEEYEITGQTTKTEATESTVVNAGKIVPQLSDLGFNPNDIESEGDDLPESEDDLLDNYSTVSFEDSSEEEGFVEIIRHITTVPPPTIPPFAVSLGKHPVFVSQGKSQFDRLI